MGLFINALFVYKYVNYKIILILKIIFLRIFPAYEKLPKFIQIKR